MPFLAIAICFVLIILLLMITDFSISEYHLVPLMPSYFLILAWRRPIGFTNLVNIYYDFRVYFIYGSRFLEYLNLIFEGIDAITMSH